MNDTVVVVLKWAQHEGSYLLGVSSDEKTAKILAEKKYGKLEWNGDYADIDDMGQEWIQLKYVVLNTLV